MILQVIILRFLQVGFVEKRIILSIFAVQSLLQNCIIAFKMSKSKVLYISHEMVPFLELTPNSKLVRELPPAIQGHGYETRMLMPRFGCINERRHRLHEVIRLSGMNIVINRTDNPLIIKVASLQPERMQVYFLDNEEFFQRKQALRDEAGKFFSDNEDRMIFFCKGIVETVKKLGWSPDIIHCHGWMSALLPAYIKTVYADEPVFRNAKIVYSVYENDFSESFSNQFVEKAKLDAMKASDMDLFSGNNCTALYKGAIAYSDAIVLDEKAADELLVQAKTDGKPVLETKGKEGYEHYADFYQEVLANNLEEIEA